jgi:hypothetical protein
MEAAPERPLTGPEAFTQQDDDAVQAQAAILLGIGSQLRGDRQKVQARSAAVAHPTDALLAEDLEEFPIPRIAPASRRYSRESLEDATRSRFGASMFEAAGEPELIAKMADDVYTTRSRETAARLAYAELKNPHPLVRVAAANAALPVTAASAEAVAILAEHTRDEDELVRDVAATSLARYMPEHPALQSLVGNDETPLLPAPSETSMIIHGTWARNNAWYQPPNGNFWQYIRNNVRPDLYGQSDFYRWSGGYSDGARDLAADQLVTWITGKNENGISLLTHSHGGSAAMLATWRGVTYDRLILMSCPVHPAKYSVNFDAVQRVVSIRVRLDLVLLADGSGSRFTDPRYNENVLPIWFNHSKSHDPATWIRFNVPNML